jgi:hypothetical protein
MLGKGTFDKVYQFLFMHSYQLLVRIIIGKIIYLIKAKRVRLH